MKQPFLKLYPQHVLGDPKLRACSPAARGIWWDLLCYMHEAEPRGHLMVKGKAMSLGEMSNLTGVPQGDLQGYLDELERHGVAVRGECGELVNKRMVRDTAKSEVGRAHRQRGLQRNQGGRGPVHVQGHLGGYLEGQGQGNPQDRGRANQTFKDQSSEARDPVAFALSTHPRLDTPNVRKAVGRWIAYQANAGLEPWTTQQWNDAVASAASFGGPDALVPAIDAAIRKRAKTWFETSKRAVDLTVRDR